MMRYCDDEKYVRSLYPNLNKSKENIKHLLDLSSTLEILEFFGLDKYPNDPNLNRIANSLSDCLYLIKTERKE